jgi:hypothetical protein
MQKFETKAGTLLPQSQVQTEACSPSQVVTDLSNSLIATIQKSNPEIGQ